MNAPPCCSVESSYLSEQTLNRLSRTSAQGDPTTTLQRAPLGFSINGLKGITDFTKYFRFFSIIGIQIRMTIARPLPIGRLNFTITSVLGNTKHFVRTFIIQGTPPLLFVYRVSYIAYRLPRTRAEASSAGCNLQQRQQFSKINRIKQVITMNRFVNHQ
ncbi:MAG: hypothetical protein AAB968_01105 [Patescibacteria group bacterium]